MIEKLIDLYKIGRPTRNYIKRKHQNLTCRRERTKLDKLDFSEVIRKYDNVRHAKLQID